MSFIITWVAVFYVLPFVLIAAMPGWRSFGVTALIGTLALAMFWTNHLRHRFDAGGNGFASAMGEFALNMLTVSIAASIVCRTITLRQKDSLGSLDKFAVFAGFFLGAPFLLTLF